MQTDRRERHAITDTETGSQRQAVFPSERNNSMEKLRQGNSEEEKKTVEEREIKREREVEGEPGRETKTERSKEINQKHYDWEEQVARQSLLVSGSPPRFPQGTPLLAIHSFP